MFILQTWLEESPKAGLQGKSRSRKTSISCSGDHKDALEQVLKKPD